MELAKFLLVERYSVQTLELGTITVVPTVTKDDKYKWNLIYQ
jgi:hypothetical protein